MSKDEMEPHPLGEIAVKVGRAYFAKNADGSGGASTMLMSQCYGSTKIGDAKVDFAVAGRTVRVSIRYAGDSDDFKAQQTYDIDMGDIIESVFALNVRRRVGFFDDAPPTVLP